MPDTVATDPPTLWNRIDQAWMISAKLIFFTMSMVIYTFYVFRGPFITEYLGFKATHYGVISAVMAAISFPCMTMWNTLADYLGRHRSVLIIITMMATVSFDALFWIPASESFRFVYVLGMLGLYSFFTSGMVPLLDYEALKLLSSRPGFTREMYGRQRLWGTIAYAVSTMVAANMMDYFGERVLFAIMPAFALVFGAILLATGPADEPRRFIFFGRTRHQETSDAADEEIIAVHGHAGNTHTQHNKTSQENLLEGEASSQQSPWRQLLTNGNFLFFLFAVFMNGMARTVMTTFLSIHWKSVLMLGKNQIAIATIFGIALEVVIFFFYKTFAIMGNYWMLVVAQAGMVLRCWAYFWLSPSKNVFWQVWVIELLKGVAFGFTHSAAIKIASESAPKGLEATAQALYTSMYAQLPAVIAALIGGKVYESYGPKMLFLSTSLISTAALALFIIKYTWDGKIRILPKKEVPETSPPSQQQRTVLVQ